MIGIYSQRENAYSASASPKLIMAQWIDEKTLQATLPHSGDRTRKKIARFSRETHPSLSSSAPAMLVCYTSGAFWLHTALW